MTTYKAVTSYLLALQTDSYVIQLVHSDSKQFKARRVIWRPETLGKAETIDYLRHMNANGYHIYCRPVGYQYVLIDDIKPGMLSQLEQAKPCLIMRTSPNNYQAFLLLPEIPSSREIAVSVCKEACSAFGGDIGSAEPDHVGRLPGFTNRKEAYRSAQGQFPYVELYKAEHQYTNFSPQGAPCAQIALVTPASVPVQKSSVPDRSRQDFNEVCKLIRQGKTDEQIRRIMESVSEKARGRRDDYIGRTINNARRILNIHP
jgi:hypothetical protein